MEDNVLGVAMGTPECLWKKYRHLKLSQASGHHQFFVFSSTFFFKFDLSYTHFSKKWPQWLQVAFQSQRLVSSTMHYLKNEALNQKTL